MPEIAELAQTVEFRLLILVFLILVGPIIAERLRMPGLVGLIFLGMLFGPFVWAWVLPNGLVAVVGAIGLLYLMFLAGIELDVNTFIANRTASITFGLATFLIPFGLSLYVAISYLDFSGTAAALVGAMWASHTLVAYTEVKSAGLEPNRAVGAAVSATVITDVLALVILGFAAAPDVADTRSSAADHVAVLPVWIGVFVLGGFCLWLLPRVTNWIFVNVGRTRVHRFVWTLGGMAAGALVSILGGMEGLVGAFLAGIGMNRLVPAHGQLMDRIEFFGAALFVPAFLISVGMSIDPAALTEPATVLLAIVFAVVVVAGKVLAAMVSGLVFGYSWPEIGMMSSLTIGQAAATLAIAQVGVSNGIFDQDVLNAAVLTVVITVIITSVGTRFFARRLEPPPEDTSSIGSQVLVRVPRAGELGGVLDIGVALAHKDSGLLTPFIVCDGGGCGSLTPKLETAVQGAIDRGQDSEGITRIDQSVVDGTVNLATESQASLILLPWSGNGIGGRFFGDSIDEIGERSPVPTIAANMRNGEWNRVMFFQGRTKNLNVRGEDSALALEVARRIATHEGIELVVWASQVDDLDEPEELPEVNEYSGRGSRGLDSITPGDLVVVPAHVAQDALALGAIRLRRQLARTSLLIVAGPRRLTVTGRQYADRVLGGAAFNRRNREALASTWEGSVR